MDIEFVGTEFPVAKRGRRQASKWDPVVEDLRANPGKVARVLLDTSRPKVQGAHRFLKTHYEGIEVVTRTEKDDEGEKFALYAKSI